MIIKNFTNNKFSLLNYLKKLKLIKFSLYLFVAIVIFFTGALTYKLHIKYGLINGLKIFLLDSSIVIIKNIPKIINSKITDTSEIIYIDVK